MVATQYLVASIIIVTDGVGHGGVGSASAIVSNLDFFFPMLPPPRTFNEKPFLARALLAEDSVWNPSRKLTPAGTHPLPLLRVSVNCHLAIFSFFKGVQGPSGKVHPAEGVGLCER